MDIFYTLPVTKNFKIMKTKYCVNLRILLIYVFLLESTGITTYSRRNLENKQVENIYELAASKRDMAKISKK